MLLSNKIYVMGAYKFLVLIMIYQLLLYRSVISQEKRAKNEEHFLSCQAIKNPFGYTSYLLYHFSSLLNYLARPIQWTI